LNYLNSCNISYKITLLIFEGGSTRYLKDTMIVKSEKVVVNY
jgi:hypothetical protein